VRNSTFTSASSELLAVLLGASASSDLLVEGNTFANGHPAISSAGGGVLVATAGAGAAPTLTYRVAGNSFRGALGTALTVQKGAGAGSFSGTIEGNVVGVSGVANSGSAQGSGLDVTLTGGGSHVVAVKNNQVRQYNNFGILLQAGGNLSGGNGSLSATVTGNTVQQVGTLGFPASGVSLNGGTNSGDAHSICLDMSGNALAGSSFGTGTEFRLRQRFLTTVRLPGYAGGNADNAAVVAFEQANNGNPVGFASNTVATGGGGFVGGAGCTQP
ncbi:MAG TPA: hypothetical protein VF705_14460, partial [Longimicrobium sp.]